MKRYNLTVPLDRDDYERLRKLALVGMRKFTDQIRLLIRQEYERTFQQTEERHEKAA
jgi:ribulose bisphosphate carboxylase small subunit